MQQNLYELAATADGPAKKWCGGNLGGDNETCATTKTIPGADAVVLGDSKPEGAGHFVCLTTAEMDSLATEWAKHRGLTV